MYYLHFPDNSNLNKKVKGPKLHPLSNHLNERFLTYFSNKQQLSVDEIMVPYFRHHSFKQFIKGKPVRFGYRDWCLNTKLGYLKQFEPYIGERTLWNEYGISMEGAVAFDLITDLPENE
ncbi:chimeric ERCC6-PGBD3 protein [Nephila pilipes]|uniref:Chimeric ERCC6-PGBD3 protein n=1 Tax=Nephila pilipes TaxID=299642 RepID=A0A8X6MYN0_NEPPI|nr:chimeric ERCC6-PGBD3 protein [Nephila pilipes]